MRSQEQKKKKEEEEEEETKELHNTSVVHSAYLVVIQPFLQDYFQFSDDLVAVLLDAEERGHVLVVGQHWLRLAVVPGGGVDSFENDSFPLGSVSYVQDLPHCLPISLHFNTGLKTRWQLEQEL